MLCLGFKVSQNFLKMFLFHTRYLTNPSAAYSWLWHQFLLSEFSVERCCLVIRTFELLAKRIFLHCRLPWSPAASVAVDRSFPGSSCSLVTQSCVTEDTSTHSCHQHFWLHLSKQIHTSLYFVHNQPYFPIYTGYRGYLCFDNLLSSVIWPRATVPNSFFFRGGSDIRHSASESDLVISPSEFDSLSWSSHHLFYWLSIFRIYSFWALKYCRSFIGVVKRSRWVSALTDGPAVTAGNLCSSALVTTLKVFPQVGKKNKSAVFHTKLEVFTMSVQLTHTNCRLPVVEDCERWSWIKNTHTHATTLNSCDGCGYGNVQVWPICACASCRSLSFCGTTRQGILVWHAFDMNVTEPLFSVLQWCRNFGVFFLNEAVITGA